MESKMSDFILVICNLFFNETYKNIYNTPVSFIITKYQKTDCRDVVNEIIFVLNLY